MQKANRFYQTIVLKNEARKTKFIPLLNFPKFSQNWIYVFKSSIGFFSDLKMLKKRW